MAKKLYPFSATWSGLTKKGKEREIAQAKYELSGIELKKKLAVIDADTVEDKAKAEVNPFGRFKAGNKRKPSSCGT